MLWNALYTSQYGYVMEQPVYITVWLWNTLCNLSTVMLWNTCVIWVWLCYGTPCVIWVWLCYGTPCIHQSVGSKHVHVEDVKIKFSLNRCLLLVYILWLSTVLWAPGADVWGDSTGDTASSIEGKLWTEVPGMLVRNCNWSNMEEWCLLKGSRAAPVETSGGSDTRDIRTARVAHRHTPQGPDACDRTRQD